MTEAKHKPEFVLTKDTPYLALTGELWSVYCEDLGENWLHYNGITLYKGAVKSLVYQVLLLPVWWFMTTNYTFFMTRWTTDDVLCPSVTAITCCFCSSVFFINWIAQTHWPWPCDAIWHLRNWSPWTKGLVLNWQQTIDKWWIISNLTFKNKAHWNLNQNTNIFIE